MERWKMRGWTQPFNQLTKAELDEIYEVILDRTTRDSIIEKCREERDAEYSDAHILTIVLIKTGKFKGLVSDIAIAKQLFNHVGRPYLIRSAPPYIFSNPELKIDKNKKDV